MALPFMSLGRFWRAVARERWARRSPTIRASGVYSEAIMKCPYCRVDNDRVIDSRSSQDGLAIRRRRECVSCSRRFTTYERPEETTIKVIKKDGSRVPFEREKIKRGLERACWKRPITSAADRNHHHRDRERRLPAVRERSAKAASGRDRDALSARPRRSGLRPLRQRLPPVQRRVRFLRRAAADAGRRKPPPAAAVEPAEFSCGGQPAPPPSKIGGFPASARNTQIADAHSGR